MAQLSESTCSRLRSLRTDIRQAQSSTNKAMGPAKRDLRDDMEPVASDLVDILEDHMFNDLDDEDNAVKDIIQKLCEGGAKDRSFTMEREMGDIR